MIGRETNYMITPEEAVKLSNEFGTASEWYFAKDLYEEWKKHLTESDAKEPEFSFFKLLSMCFNTGRINGIREERSLRKEK